MDISRAPVGNGEIQIPIVVEIAAGQGKWLLSDREARGLGKSEPGSQVALIGDAVLVAVLAGPDGNVRFIRDLVPVAVQSQEWAHQGVSTDTDDDSDGNGQTTHKTHPY
jgi:hypothetical protein